MSYQPEERYWTDYLRIALPVVGLLLMLGLFWFWAASLIGDEDNNDPNNLAAVATATAPAPSPSPSSPPATEPSGNTAGGTTGDETQTADENAGGATDAADANANNPTEAADSNAANDQTSGDQTTADQGNGDEEPACDPGDFCEGVIATVNSDNVRLRNEPSTEGGDETVIDLLQEGDEVVLIGDPTEGDDGFTWVEVESDLGDGFVTTDFLEAE